MKCSKKFMILVQPGRNTSGNLSKRIFYKICGLIRSQETRED